MKVIRVEDTIGTDREVRCPYGAFTSLRAVLKSEGMGFSVHKTIIPVGPPRFWHYKHHLEACYCIAGRGVLQNMVTGEGYEITTDTVYLLDDHDPHTFQAIEPCVLISIFNPPVTGREVHRADGSYEPTEGGSNE